METLFQDLRYACRSLRQNPGFTAVTVATLALGIGANAGIFSVINAALLKAVPFPNPDRVVLLFERDVLQEGGGRNVVSLANFLDWEAQSQSFTAMAAARQNSFNLGGDDERLLPERIPGAICSWGLFPALGIAPAVGRPFSVEEDKPGARHVAVISYSLWQRRFGGASDILQRQVRLDSENYDIVGVMPRGFAYPAHDVEVWAPVQPALSPANLHNRANHQFYVVARVRAGIPLEQAKAELDGIMRRIRLNHPDELIGRGATLYPMAEISTRRSREALLVLFAAVGCLLLIACVNIANLLLARGSRRGRELAIRMAMGAARGRLLRQMLTESLLLSVLGAAVGLMLADGLVAALAAKGPALLNSRDIDTSAEIALDRWVFLFTAGVAMLAGVGTGLLPAWQATRADLTGSLKEGGRALSAGRQQRRFRSLLVAAEVGLSVILLVAAGLLVRSFGELRRVDPGVRTDHLLTAGLQLPDARYGTRQQISVFARQLQERLRALPGVRSVGLVSCLPVAGYCGDNAFFIEGRPLPPGQFVLALNRGASPDYFATAGIPLLSGRDFTPQDGRGFEKDHPRESAVVVSQSMAKKFWPQGDALAQRIYFGDGVAEPRYRIVGIVGDVLIDLDEHPRPTMYLPLLEGGRTSFYAVVRTDGDPASLAGGVRHEIGNLDPDLPAFRVRTVEELLDQSAAQRQFTVLLLASFALLAMVLAAVGLYGVLSYTVAQRTNEIGIRLALGAGRSQVHRLVLIEGLRPAAIGVALGLIGAAGTSRLLGSLLFGIGPGDEATFLTAPILLLAVAAAACAVPAWRATQVDPMVALRNE
ncbi:MAG: ABC transporter permease [Acidobacteriia bacterium]|nr:ABC transporter permease [Terriglobia bacterium]